MHALINGQANSGNPIATILWEIKSSEWQHAAYLIGTCHVVGKSWLDQWKPVTECLSAADCLYTECFPSTTVNTPGLGYIKALDLLSSEQYDLLDAFFRERSGESEGLEHEEAKDISVVGMISAIKEMLIRKNAQRPFHQMDYELYQSFVHANKMTKALEYSWDLDFRPDDKAAAKSLLDVFVRQVHHAREWDTDRADSIIARTIAWYHSLSFNYALDEEAPSPEYAGTAVTVAERNRRWLPGIMHALPEGPTVVAVGIGHLFYNTGLVTLLQQQGLILLPVSLR
ncbi:MAG TPA: TraB/GumN family protein [Chitinophaga sp.]|uniref:TraB/GumN family protein n=1 Tax=Chitinophaga sp. TaxID=1869181 RepID=UPI002C2B582E|nr:TraB/GumN family protein [Chitinophaga sp.]HVI45578.1 TraB/GumN family protein [Chitinophaga sp.]